MKFGKEFKTHLEETIPEWRDKFLCYKPLKKLLKHYPSPPDSLLLLLHPASQLHHPPPPLSPAAALDGGGAETRSLVDLQEWFVGILNEELEKFNDFFVDKEEDFVIRLQELKDRIQRLKVENSKDGIFTSDCDFSEEMMDIRKDLVTIHGEMVLLKNYSSLNLAGLVKILKKYDKRTGGLLRLPFTQLALHQPFSLTEPLSRLVHECEENLEVLLPLEEEVIESTNRAQIKLQPRLHNQADITRKTSLTIGDETMDIYRSTLAAMKAIRGLQKASSTYDPLFSSFFKSRDAEGSGDITAENSISNCSATLQNEEEIDQKDSHSH